MGEATEHKRYIVRFPAEHEKDVLDYLKQEFRNNSVPILVRDDKYRKKKALGGIKEEKSAKVTVDVNPGKVYGGKELNGSLSNELHAEEFIWIEGDFDPEQEDIVKNIVHNAPKFTADSAESIGKKWYSVRTASGKEQEAKKYIERVVEERKLQNYIAQVLIPSEKVYTANKKSGKHVQTERLFYPGYILVEANMTDEIQAVIRDLPNVAGVLSDRIGNSADRIPIPLRPSEVKRILGQMDELVGEDVETINPFHVGEAVKINDGPFNGFDGTVDKILDDKKKINVVVKIFGRKTLLELNYTQVTKE